MIGPHRSRHLAVPTLAFALAASPALAATPAPAAAPGPWAVLDVQVASSLSAGFAATGHPQASQLSALTGRLFMWDLDMRKDIERGDRLRIVFREEEGGLVIGAARYRSRRRATDFEAFRFQAPGDAFASYWTRQGHEVPRRLRNGPLRDYDQITALLKDRPTHRGMDFKTPVGTTVHAHRPGTITRADWRLRGNGHCVEVRFDDGTLAKYLHLSAIKARPGTRVRPGQVIALTGNTGRSTAPHLHYELHRGSRVLDPVAHHGTVRRTLPRAALADLGRVVKALGPLLDAPAAPGPAVDAGAPDGDGPPPN